MENLEGRTAVVTGAGSGMGRAFAERFARAGMNVVLADIEAPKLDEAVAAIQASGASAIGVPTDVTDAAAVDRLRDAAMAGLFPGHSAYGASKWAVVGITEGLYQACAPAAPVSACRASARVG